MKNHKNYYLGLDIGTDSVGYAVTDENYNLIKFHGEPAWGVTIFDAAALNGERRTFRTARRRLDRRQQRVQLVQELFAKEIEKKDPRFYIRLRESFLYREDASDEHILFNDVDYSDKEYHAEYPTIHHLICDLMNNTEAHDVRVVYIACAWLVAHRGHFLSNIDIKNIEKLKDIESVYTDLMNYFSGNGYDCPWKCQDISGFADVMKKKLSISAKNKELVSILLGSKKPSKKVDQEGSFPFNQELIIKLLAGSKCSAKDLFGKEEYAEFESFSLGDDDEKLGSLMAEIGDDFELIKRLKAVYDWALLVDNLGDYKTISEAKVAVYEQHKADLSLLKHFVRKYIPEKYDEVFRSEETTGNYVSYSYHTNDGNTSKVKKASIEVFSDYAKKLIKNIVPAEEDVKQFDDMCKRLETNTFMPKQKNTDNRVIPQQLYCYELMQILKNAEKYLEFLNGRDEDGLSVSDKIASVFTFKIPYFVGPLNEKSSHAWIKREAGKIYPWNFEKMVDLDESEERFIKRMTNTCTYMPGEPVLPKDSLLYHKYMVLNEINNLRINGEKISVELKQDIYNDLFMNFKKVSKKRLIDYLISNGVIEKGEEEHVTGIDITINSNLAPQIALKRLLGEKSLSQSDAERIIERSSYAEDKGRLSKWIEKYYPDLSEEDRKYICNLKFKDFGRLSKKFLCELEGAKKDTGEVFTIIGALWNTQNNLMELLSDKYTFIDEIREYSREYYAAHPTTLSGRLDELYISNAVKRPIYRTLAIVNDLEKAFGKPKKVFIEMARGGRPEQKGKRTSSRKQQILDLYKKCKDEDVKILKQQIEEMGEYADNKLQGDKLFLYYMQLGKSMYSGTPIELEKLSSKAYDIDHIYPQAFVKDDSIINNKVLVLSSENGAKSNIYPIDGTIREKMAGYWVFLKNNGLISEEKYKRLVRNRPFSDDEKLGFINRQLTETSQSTKAVATILKEKFPDTDIVYSKAGLVSDFRHEFDIYKSRLFNDLHHASDAYLNIVVGNVYDMKFSKKWFNVHSNYSIKTKTVFTNTLICDGKTVWDGKNMLQQVKKTAQKNNAHFTKYAFFKKGGLFDQMPVSASEGLVPLKKGLSTQKYGGYNKASAMFYIPVRYKAGKKSEVFIMSVEMLAGKRFLADESFAKEYAYQRMERILNKKVEEITFPMGMRPWKVNTMLSLDGFRVCISGIGSGATKLIAQSVTQFSEDPYWKFYLKKLEKYFEKISNNKNYIYSEEYDQISREKNIELYRIYIGKYENTIWKKRRNAPLETLKEGANKFEELSLNDQVKALLNIQQTFGRIAGGIDLKLIGGAGKAAGSALSAAVSNWKKDYNSVKIIDSSVTGLWKKESENILELL